MTVSEGFAPASQPFPTGGAGGAATDAALPIRRAEAGDLLQCAGIVNNYLDSVPWLPRLHPREAIVAMFTPDLLETRQMIVAGPPGAVVGYLSLLPTGFIPALYLIPGARGQGHGKRLLDRAKALHPAFLDLTAFAPNTAAHAFYRREGFVEDPARRDDAPEEGVPALWFHWEGER